ncbi:hypothetical protein BGZ59_003838 [Podila verticillata]|nr:hypothetical protein BGZ59_003838 [Podila verticillata]KFH64379.1 hypothetical protein MVEG_10204 [Podila verticillata NRRL 6337]
MARTYAALWSQIVQDTKGLATQLMGRMKSSCAQQDPPCMVPQLRQPNSKSHSVPPCLTSSNVYQQRTPNTLTRFSSLYATFPRHHHQPHNRLHNKNSNNTLKNRSSRRFSLWEVQLELGEIPGMLSPNILEPYNPPMSQLLPSTHNNNNNNNTNSTRLFIESSIANGNNNINASNYSSFSSYVFSDIDVRVEEEEKTIEGKEEMEDGEEEESDGDTFGDFYFPDGIYSYIAPLHPSDSTSSLLPGPLPWASAIVDACPYEMEDETTPFCPSSSSAEIIFVKYETSETILEDEGEEEIYTDEGPSTALAGIATATFGIHPLDGHYAVDSDPALEEGKERNQADDAMAQHEQTQVVSFNYAAPSSSTKSTRPAQSLLFSSVHSEMRQDRKDSGVFVMHDDGFIKLENENLLAPRPTSVMAHDVMSVFSCSPDNSEIESVTDQAEDATSSRLHMYPSLMMSSSLISLSA